MSLSKSKTAAFLLECASLSTPLARVVVISSGITLLTLINVGSMGFPTICLWENIFGYCPAKGTTHALSAFFHGDWKSAFHYHWNVVIIVPLLAVLLATDTVKILRGFPKRVEKTLRSTIK
jgi:hypothetical protein